MRLYSDFGLRRTFEITGDLVAVLIVVIGIITAVTLHAAIAGLSVVGDRLAEAGRNIADPMTSIGETLSGVPLIGGGIAAPFDAASDGGQTLISAGTGFSSGVETVATIVGWSLAVLVVLIVLVGWVGPRLLVSVRRARLARLSASAPSRDLLALRALANRPARLLARIDDPVGGWRRGDAGTVGALAALELRAAGVRMQPAP